MLGFVLPKSWVPDPDFISLQAPMTGVLAQGEMPNSWNPYLGLTDQYGVVSHTPDPVLGLVKGNIGIPSGQHGVVYSFPKGADRFPNGDSSSIADIVAGSAGYGSPPYSFPRSGFGGLAQ